MMQARVRDGFTLIEIIIALFIVGLMAAAGFTGVTYYQRWARETAVKQTLGGLKTLINTYEMRTGDFPNSLEDLVRCPSGMDPAEWGGPYGDKKDIPKDPWGRSYQYRKNPEGSEFPFELYSEGDPRAKPKIRYDVHKMK